MTFTTRWVLRKEEINIYYFCKSFRVFSNWASIKVFIVFFSLTMAFRLTKENDLLIIKMSL